MHTRSSPPPIQRRARDGRLVERQRVIADDLRLLVPLSSQQHKIAGLCHPDRLLDGLPAIHDGEECAR